MKRIYLIVIGLIIGVSNFAQGDEKLKLTDRHALEFSAGVHNSLIQSNFQSALPGGNSNFDFYSNPTLNPSFKMSYYLRLSRLFYLESGVKFSTEGAWVSSKHFVFDDNVVSSEDRIKVAFVSLPLNFTFMTNNPGKIRFSASVGAGLNLDFPSWQNPSQSIGLQGEIGCLFPLGELADFQLSAEMSDLSFYQVNSQGLELKSYGLNAGLKYYLGRIRSPEKKNELLEKEKVNELKNNKKDIDFRHSISFGITNEHCTQLGDLHFVANPYGLDYTFEYINREFHCGLSASLMYGYRLSKFWSLEFGIEYLKKGVSVSYKHSFLDNIYSVKNKLHFLALSNNLIFNYQPKKIGVYAKLGINIHENLLKNYDIADFKLSPGYLSTIGASLRLSDQVNCFLGLEYRLQHTPSPSIYLNGFNYSSVGLNTSIYFLF